MFAPARHVLVVALASVLLGPLLAVEAEACAGPSCDRGSDSETTSLLQLNVDTASRQPRHLQLPSWDDVKGAASDVLGDAKAWALGQTLESMTAVLNQTLGDVKGFTDDFSLQMQDGQLDLKAGMAAILAKQFNVSTSSLYGEEAELIEKVRANLAAAASVWGRICAAGQSLESTMATALTTMKADQLKDKVDKSLNAANGKCSETARKLDQLRVKLTAFVTGFSTSLPPASGESQLAAQRHVLNEVAENVKKPIAAPASQPDSVASGTASKASGPLAPNAAVVNPVEAEDSGIATAASGADSDRNKPDSAGSGTESNVSGPLAPKVDGVSPSNVLGSGIATKVSGVDSNASEPDSVVSGTGSNASGASVPEVGDSPASGRFGPKVDGVHPGVVQDSGITNAASGDNGKASLPASKDTEPGIVSSGAESNVSGALAPKADGMLPGDAQGSGNATAAIAAENNASEPDSVANGTGSNVSGPSAPQADGMHPGDAQGSGNGTAASAAESNASELNSEASGTESNVSGPLSPKADGMLLGDVQGSSNSTAASAAESKATEPGMVASGAESKVSGPLAPKADGMLPGDVQGSGNATASSAAESNASELNSEARGAESNVSGPAPKADGMLPVDLQGSSNATAASAAESKATEPGIVANGTECNVSGPLAPKADGMQPGDVQGSGNATAASAAESKASEPDSVASGTESNVSGPLAPKADDIQPGDVQGSGIATAASAVDSKAVAPVEADRVPEDVGAYPVEKQDAGIATAASAAESTSGDSLAPTEEITSRDHMQDSEIAGPNSNVSVPVGTDIITDDVGVSPADEQNEAIASVSDQLAPNRAGTNLGDEQVGAGDSEGEVAVSEAVQDELSEAGTETPQGTQESELGANILMQSPAELPTEVCHDLNKTLQDTLKQAQDFSGFLNGAFDDLTRRVGDSFQGQLNEVSLAKVHFSFASLSKTVKDLIGGALNGTDLFLTGLQEGVGVAGLAAGVRTG